jgi:1-acyl-sn-glycerol-3-phosphate acyltransferase
MSVDVAAAPRPLWRRIPPGRYIWSVILKMLILVLCRLEVYNARNVPPTGAGLIYYNHIHWLDPVLICGRSRRYAVPLTKIEASKWPVVGHMLRWYHVIFIQRGQVDREALKAVWQVLNDGDIIVISPEGTRSPTGAMQQAKEGLAFVARRAPEAWLIPCAVTGTPNFEFSLRAILKRQPILLTYGEPFAIGWPEGAASRETLREMTDEAMFRLAPLLPAEMRGDYAATPPPERWLRPLPESNS